MEVNDTDGQCVVAYKILMVASLHCTKQHGSQKKECNTLGAAYPRVNLSDVDGLEHLTWAVYDGVYVPGDPPVLTGHHNWEHIIMGATLGLIFCGKTNDEHCKPLTIASLNAEQAMKLAQQQGLLQLEKRRSWAMPAAAAQRTPTIQSVVNVPPWTVSSHSMGGVQATSLDYKEDSNGESPFHEINRRIMMRSSLVRTCLDPMWQTMKWLEACGESLGEEDITWWLLVMPLTDGGIVAAKELTKHLVAVWRWMAQVSIMPVCPPALTMLNIGQLLEGYPREGYHTPWLLAYTHTLQCVGEAAEGRTWHPSGMHFTLQISLLVDAFIEETGAELIELDTTSCWGQPPEKVCQQKDDGPFADVISYLNELA